MKFSESWLREWVQPSVDHDQLLEQLTMAGLEVDGVEPVAGAFSGVVVGRVEAVEKHPNADKLSVCSVADGEQVWQVVCGAPNVRAGLTVAFARIGAVLPGNFKIKKAKLRKVESSGMLCSASELALGDDADGIVELPEALTVGADLREALALEDVMIEVDLTPNRGDCLSLKGIAREVGVLNDVPMHEPDVEPVVPTHETIFPVRLEDPQGCPRYLGRVIKGIDLNRAAPLWMTERLRRSGIRSIDPVVDVTNYVMIELGQPMHAFDLNVLQDEIVVRRAAAGEKLTLLDGKEISADDDTLLITDGQGPVAMAGVMGGARSGISESTVDVFLECAFFAPLSVAGTARRYGLHTDASHRYERGVDYALQSQAIERATALLLEVVGGEPGPVFEAVDAEHLPADRTATLRLRRLDQLLGTQIEAAEVDRVLSRLDFELVERVESAADGVSWTIRAPSHRFDIAIEADLVEEICRVHGYNNIPSKRPVTDLTLRNVKIAESTDQALKGLLTASGYQEVVTYSFVDPVLLDRLDPGAKPLRLENPMSSEQSVMRTTLLPGLIDVWRNNQARQLDRLRIFELGLCFLPGETLQQVSRLGGLIAGARASESWHDKAAPTDFFDLKGDIEQLVQWRGADQVESRPRTADPVLHPGQSADLWLDGVWAGRYGRLHPALQAALDLEAPVYLFELEAAVVQQRPLRRYQRFSKYPAVRRDLALVVDEAVPAAALEQRVKALLGPLLVDFRLFDVYQGKGIDSAQKSLGMGLTWQDASATLAEEQITESIAQVVSALADEFGAQLR
ncbi:MAG: phenylalanine--tRNA ligase subunit beta [Pseudomonadales bacterium]